MMMTKAKSHRQNRPKNNHSEKKKKESEKFFREDDEEDEESNSHGFAWFGFCTMNKGNKLQLLNMLLLNSCSTVDLFCNKNLVTKIWTSKNSMTVKVNGGDLKTHQKAYVKNYGELWFDERAMFQVRTGPERSVGLPHNPSLPVWVMCGLFFLLTPERLDC